MRRPEPRSGRNARRGTRADPLDRRVARPGRRDRVLRCSDPLRCTLSSLSSPAVRSRTRVRINVARASRRTSRSDTPFGTSDAPISATVRLTISQARSGSSSTIASARPVSGLAAARPMGRATRSAVFRPDSLRSNARHSSSKRSREGVYSMSSRYDRRDRTSASTSWALTRRSSTPNSVMVKIRHEVRLELIHPHGSIPEEAEIGRPTPPARRLVEASVSPNTQRAYAGALRRFDA